MASITDTFFLTYKGSNATVGKLFEMRRGSLRKGDFPEDKPSRFWHSLAEWKRTIDSEVSETSPVVEIMGFFLLYKGSKVMVRDVTDTRDNKKWAYLHDWIDSVDKGTPEGNEYTGPPPPAGSLTPPPARSSPLPTPADPPSVVKGTKYRLGSSTVVGLKDGTLLELRRGPATWPSFKADQKTWRSFAEWRETIGSTLEGKIEVEEKKTKETKEVHPDVLRLIPHYERVKDTIYGKGNLWKCGTNASKISRLKRQAERRSKLYAQIYNGRDMGYYNKGHEQRYLDQQQRYLNQRIERILATPERYYTPNTYSTSREFMYMLDGNPAYIWFNVKHGVFATGTDYPELFGSSLEEIGVLPETKIWTRYNCANSRFTAL